MEKQAIQTKIEELEEKNALNNSVVTSILVKAHIPPFLIPLLRTIIKSGVVVLISWLVSKGFIDIESLKHLF